MNLKMWLRGATLLTILLLSTLLSACSTPSSSTSTLTTDENKCSSEFLVDAGKLLGEAVIASLSDHENPIHELEEGDGSNLPQSCFQALGDFFTQLANPNSQQQVIANLNLGQLNSQQYVPTQTPETTVKVTQLSSSTYPATYTSQIISNCARPEVTETFSYSIPVVLVVGSSDNNSTYVEPSVPVSSNYTLFPSSGRFYFPLTDDQDKIAIAVYSDYQLSQYFNQSDSFQLKLPANKMVQLNLPLTIDYWSGWGVVNAGQIMGWDYNYKFQPNFDPNNLTAQEMTVTPCG